MRISRGQAGSGTKLPFDPICKPAEFNIFQLPSGYVDSRDSVGDWNRESAQARSESWSSLLRPIPPPAAALSAVSLLLTLPPHLLLLPLCFTRLAYRLSPPSSELWWSHPVVVTVADLDRGFHYS